MISTGGKISYLVTTVNLPETFVAAGRGDTSLVANYGDMPAPDVPDGEAPANLDEEITKKHEVKVKVHVEEKEVSKAPAYVELTIKDGY